VNLFVRILGLFGTLFN